MSTKPAGFPNCGWCEAEGHLCPVHTDAGFGERFTAPCDNEREPDGQPCDGVLTFEPLDVQAKCPACGAWTGRLASSIRLAAPEVA